MNNDQAPLTIQRLALTEDGRDFVLRFGGRTQDFADFVSELKQQGHDYARWDPDQLEGRGAWLVDFSLFKSYADRFTNYALLVDRAIDRHFNRPTPR